MVHATFTRLPAAIQARVQAALLAEFSQHPLQTAQVARIVDQAGIARGAFYKYFDDLTDAYQFVFQAALTTIHQGLPAQPSATNTAAFVASIQAFVAQTDATGYRALITMHYRYNEGFLGATPSALGTGPDAATRWAVTTLYHQTVRDILLDPSTTTARLAQLQAVLTKGV